MKRLYIILHILPVFFPRPLKIWFYNNYLGHEIASTASIGLSYLHVRKIKMAPGSKIGNFNFFQNLDLLQLGEESSIGSFNKAIAVSSMDTEHFCSETHRVPALIIGNHSGIVKGNFFDCNNTISIGNFTLVAGFGSHFFTHGVDVRVCQQSSAPIKIGSRCMIATRCLITKGAVLPDFSILGAGSLLHKPEDQSYKLYSGVPAIPVKDLDPTSAYFYRQQRYIP